MFAHSNLIRQRLNGCVPVAIAGRNHVLRFTLESMAACEEYAAMSRFRQLLALTWAMLLHENTYKTPDDLGAVLDYAEVGPISDAVRECLNLSTLPARGNQPKKSTDWMRLWSFAEYDLRITEERFWSLTPKQFAALADRHNEAYVRNLHGSAMVAATLANIYRDKDAKIVKPADLLPKLPTPEEEERVKKIEAIADLTAAAARFGHGVRSVKVIPTKPNFHGNR